jgi:hypothetical protein
VSDRPDGVGGHPLAATVAGLVLFVAGLLIGIGAIEADRTERERRVGTLQAEGIVIAQIKQSSANSATFAPLVAFTTSSGERVTFTARDVDGTSAGMGSTLPVLYHAGNPADARIDRTVRHRVATAIAGAASVLLIALGAYVAWYARRWQAARAEGGGAV